MNGNTAGGTDVIRQIRTLFTLGSMGTLDDAHLLEIFLRHRGLESEDAFAAIVRRHGPLVLGVCRRMLAEPSDADDAFQATFLILARRASAIGKKASLASWLHGVAVRAAREIRRGEARRRRREERAMQEIRTEAPPADDHGDLLPLLDEELARLPESYRLALLACEIEGKSRRDAARQLGISEGTLSSRLAPRPQNAAGSAHRAGRSPGGDAARRRLARVRSAPSPRIAGRRDGPRLGGHDLGRLNLGGRPLDCQ